MQNPAQNLLNCFKRFPVFGSTRSTLKRTCKLKSVHRPSCLPHALRILLLLAVTYSLAQRSALPNSDCIAFFNTECGTNMRSQVCVSLLVSCILWDEVKVFSTDDQRPVHLRGDNSSCEDTASNGHQTGEWAFLVWKKSPSQKLRLEIIGLYSLPMYVPSMAVLGVRKPNPTSLYHLRPPFPILLLFAFVLWLRKM